MELFNTLRNAIANLFKQRRLNADIKEEIEHHLAMTARKLEQSGLSPTEARRQALREFGHVDSTVEATQDSWGVRIWQDLVRDAALAWRRMKQYKGFSAVIILTFALGVGLNTIMFSLFNSLWLNPGLYPGEDRVVRVYEHFDGGWDDRGLNPRGTSPHFYLERAEQSELSEALGLTMVLDATVTGADAGLVPEYLPFLGVTPSLFRVLGVPPLIGRVFDEKEAERENDGVAVLFHDYWKTRFNGDPAVIGTTIYTDGKAREIIGVMPKTFQIPDIRHLTDGSPELNQIMLVPWRPQTSWLDSPDQRHFPWAGCFARLKPGVTPVQFRDELNAINTRNGSLYPVQREFEQRHGHRTEVATMHEDLLRNNRLMLSLLQGAMFFVLLIACVNIVSLVLSRNSARRQEFALRLSLGASKPRLALQLVTEMWLLSTAGGIAGLVVAALGLQALDAVGVFKYFVVSPRLDLDASVVVFALIVSSMAGVASGLGSMMPLLRDRSLRAALAEEARTGTAGRESKTFRATLLATQIVFTAVLMVGGCLLLRSFSQILKIDPGFKTEKLLTGVVRLPQDRYDEEGTLRFFAEFERRLQEMPGVEAVGLTNWPPLKISGAWTWNLIRPSDDYLNGELRSCLGDAVSEHYFEALDIQVLQGRVFNAADYHSRSAVAVIDRRVAEMHFPGENPIGQLIAVPFKSRPLNADTELQWLRIVGVVEPIRVNDLLGYSPLGGMVYQTYVREIPYWAGFTIRTKDDPTLLLKPLRALLTNLDPMAAVGLPETMADAIRRRYGSQQTFLIISLTIAAVALLICTLGVYGMLTHSVSMQSKEIAIRRALGAPNIKVMSGVLAYWLKTAAVGLAIGLVGALLASHFLSGVLYEIQTTDPVSYAGTFSLLGLTLVGAAVVSAHKAVSLDMIEVLRR